MAILITGGAGYIGSVMVEQLVARGERVVVLDDLSRGHRRACRKAAKLANIKYGQANGFTCHSFRHTFVTRMMEATGNDVALVMSYSGHRSMESFKIYLHPTQKGSILANQHLETVGHLLATFTGIQGTTGTSGTDGVNPKSLELKEVAL